MVKGMVLMKGTPEDCHASMWSQSSVCLRISARYLILKWNNPTFIRSVIQKRAHGRRFCRNFLEIDDEGLKSIVTLETGSPADDIF